MQDGWISLHRKIRENPIWYETPFDRSHAWMDLILSANHEDRKFSLGNEWIMVKRGSFVTSELKLMNKWGWSKSKIRDFLKLLQKENMIVKISDRKKTTINIVNYDIYQDCENYNQTTEKPQTDQLSTDSRLITDTNNNDNNIYIYPHQNKEKLQGNKNKKSEYSEMFEDFWSIYPKKIGKVKSYSNWNSLLKKKVLPDILIKAGSNYAKHCLDTNIEDKYIKYPEGFLSPKNKYYESYINYKSNKPKEDSKADKSTKINSAAYKPLD